MRIAVNASIYDGRPSGLGIYAREIVRALHALGQDLVVFTSRPRAMPASRRVSPLVAPSRGLPGHAARLLWTQIVLPFATRRSGAGVLLNPVPEGPLWPGLRQVTVVHDVLPLFFPSELPRQQWYFRRFVPAVLAAAAAVIADSAQTRADVLRWYGLDPARVAVVAPGVDHARFHLGAGLAKRVQTGPYLLYVGNLLPHKNLARLIEAFVHVQTDALLVVSGHRDPRYWPALLQEVRAQGVEGRVRFLGFVDDADLPSLYAGALCVVVPSLYEGFGLPVLEAMACGTPVIASTTGGLHEAAGDVALRVDPLNVEELAAALQRIVDDADLRAAMRSRGPAHAAQFTWDRTARGVLEVLARAAHARME